MQTTRFHAKPFVKWAGGKGQLLSTFEQLLPKKLSELEDATYIEPFIGGGAMLFFLLQKFNNIKRAIINDLNPDLVNVYNVVKNKPEKLIKELSVIQREYFSISDDSDKKSFYLNARESFNKKDLSDIDNATLLIFLNRTCFNGLYRVNSKGEFNVPFGKYKNPKICDEETIYADSKLLQSVEILNGDFEQIEQYATSHTFIYFDPPYRPLDSTSNFNSYAKEAFNDSEQIRLKKFFDHLSSKQCLLMLSNSDCKGRNHEDTFFDELYKNYIIERVFASRFVNANPDKRGKLTELLIRNYTDTQSTNHIHKPQLPELKIKSYDQSTYGRRI